MKRGVKKLQLETGLTSILAVSLHLRHSGDAAMRELHTRPAACLTNIYIKNNNTSIA